MALVYWAWLAHTPATMLFDFGEYVGAFLLGAWLRAWVHEQI